MQNWSYLEIGRLRMFQLRCLNKHRDSITHNSKKNNSKTHPARRLGRESPLAPRFLDFDLTTTEGRAFASFSWHQKLRSEMVNIVLNISSPSWKTMLWRSLNSIAFGASECRDQNAIPRKLGLTQFLGALIELGLAASAKISTLLSITWKTENIDTRKYRKWTKWATVTSGLGAGGFEKNCWRVSLANSREPALSHWMVSSSPSTCSLR